MTERSKHEGRTATHVVLFDPMAAPSGYWDLVTDLLDDVVEVVRFQRHGCADLEDELPYVLDVLTRAGTERVIAVGASVGGLMARRLATVLSVAGMVLVDSASEGFRVKGLLPQGVRSALRAEVVDNEQGIDLRWTHCWSRLEAGTTWPRIGRTSSRPPVRYLAAPGSVTTEQLTRAASAD